MLMFFTVFIKLKILFLMVLDRLCTVDGISSSSRLSGKQFMMSFSCKMEWRQINSSLLLSKLMGVIYFGGFFICHLIFVYTFDKTISVMKSSHLFWKLLCCKFWAWSPYNLSSVCVKLVSRFRHSFLRYLRGIYFKRFEESSSVTWKVMISYFRPCSGVNKAFAISCKWHYLLFHFYNLFRVTFQWHGLKMLDFCKHS